MERLFGSDDGPDGDAGRRRRAGGLVVGLLYLTPLIGEIADYSAVKRGLAVLGLAGFVAGYLGTALSRRRMTDPVPRFAWILLVFFTSLVVGLPFVFGREWIGMPIYLGVVLTITLPYRWAPLGVVGATILAGVQTGILTSELSTAAGLTLTTFAIGLLMLMFRRARMLVRQLQEARGEVARLAATEERLRIARDMHDLLGHSLSLIVLKSELAGRLTERDPAKVAQEVKDIESVARQALADVRETVSGYRRRPLTDELDSARSVMAAAGVNATVRTSGTPLPDQLDGLFGWAVREAATNVVRHARATRCEITVKSDRKGAALEVRDDGAGATNFVPGNGLIGLTERIEDAGGTVDAGPLPGGGFRLAVRLPRLPSPEPATESR
jgi:two-component system sensor histidine kinase DesK